MKHRIAVETRADRTSSAWLLHLAILMHQLRISPEALGWERTVAGGWNFWLFVSDEACVRPLVEALQSTAGIRRVIASVERSDEEIYPAAMD